MNIKDTIFLQSGISTVIPLVMYQQYLDHGKMLYHLNNAEIIICHGGFGIISESIKANKKLIIIPRLKKYNEAVNPQIELGEYLANREPRIKLLNENDNLQNNILELYEINTPFLNEYSSIIPNMILETILNL
ncbi:hypothetical protein HN827_08520 [archaeon]|jgi:UDP-N-acetylglucosamine transferase subunit ALG13|nr:hypothetical protein [archaeon]